MGIIISDKAAFVLLQLYSNIKQTEALRDDRTDLTCCALRALLHAAGCCQHTLHEANIHQSQVARAYLESKNRKYVQDSVSRDLSQARLGSLERNIVFHFCFFRKTAQIDGGEEENTTGCKLKIRKGGSRAVTGVW